MNSTIHAHNKFLDTNDCKVTQHWEACRNPPSGVEGLGLQGSRQRTAYLEITEGSSALGVHHALWDALAIKVRQVVDQREVLPCVGSARQGGRDVLIFCIW